MAHNEVVIVIDDVRSVSFSDTDSGSVVITVEDPHTVAVVEIPQEELREIYNEIHKRLK